MTNHQSTNFFSNYLPLKVWVLAPSIQTMDENLDYFYDFSQSIAEFEKAFSALNIIWKWQPVTINNYQSIIEKIVEEKNKQQLIPVVFNICDGDEVNGTPGISVVKLLEKNDLFFTGADSFFYDITTSKISMKKAFDTALVSTAKWKAIHSPEMIANSIFKELGTPLIVKPSVSGGSMGVSIKNVIYNNKELVKQVAIAFNGYRGWNLVSDGLIAETFINGPEYTVMIIGSYDKPQDAIIYNPVERVFHPSLPDEEKFLSFDRLWEIYETETEMPNQENFFEYQPTDPKLIEEIKKLSWEAYVAVKGTGYTRVDIRRDKNTGIFYVLEVNAQCGISEDEDFTSIGAILKYNDCSFADLVKEIIKNAFIRTTVQPTN